MTKAKTMMIVKSTEEEEDQEVERGERKEKKMATKTTILKIRIKCEKKK